MIIFDMSRESLWPQLADAERRIAEAARYIAEQAALVGQLERDGRDTTDARRLLASFEKMQADLMEVRNRIERELAANDN
jgi:hypothetical protein